VTVGGVTAGGGGHWPPHQYTNLSSSNIGCAVAAATDDQEHHVDNRSEVCVNQPEKLFKREEFISTVPRPRNLSTQAVCVWVCYPKPYSTISVMHT
jgi:hypothetical protein